MNKLVELEYDSFEKTKDVRLKDIISPTINNNTLGTSNIYVLFASHQKEDREPEILIYIGNLSEQIQEILIKLNDDELIKYEQVHNTSRSSACVIAITDLEKICQADTIEIRIKNQVGHTDFTSNELRFGARVLYNAIIDDNAYANEVKARELEQEEREAEEATQKTEEQRKKREAAQRAAAARKAAAEKRRQQKAQKLRDAENAKSLKIAILIIIGIAATIFLIWSFV